MPHVLDAVTACWTLCRRGNGRMRAGLAAPWQLWPCSPRRVAWQQAPVSEPFGCTTIARRVVQPACCRCGCPVKRQLPHATPPAQIDAPAAAGDPTIHRWYGNQALWGCGVSCPLSMTPQPRMEHQAPGWRVPHGTLTVSARKLDGPSAGFHGEVPGGDGWLGFVSSVLVWPPPGCWQVTGTVAQHLLTIVMRGAGARLSGEAGRSAARSPPTSSPQLQAQAKSRCSDPFPRGGFTLCDRPSASHGAHPRRSAWALTFWWSSHQATQMGPICAAGRRAALAGVGSVNGRAF